MFLVLVTGCEVETVLNLVDTVGFNLCVISFQIPIPTYLAISDFYVLHL